MKALSLKGHNTKLAFSLPFIIHIKYIPLRHLLNLVMFNSNFIISHFIQGTLFSMARLRGAVQPLLLNLPECFSFYFYFLRLFMFFENRIKFKYVRVLFLFDFMSVVVSSFRGIFHTWNSVYCYLFFSFCAFRHCTK